MDDQLESKFPEDWRKELNELRGDELSTALARHRTGMATQRTELSLERTDLSLARSHMANERTHLAYLRTSLALMTFGVTINRFSIYLRENKALPRVHTVLYQTEFVGLGMVLLGILILIWALYHYRKVSNQINSDTYSSPQKSLTIITFAIILMGGFSVFWMIVNQQPGD